jgi:hypothetical protein
MVMVMTAVTRSSGKGRTTQEQDHAENERSLHGGIASRSRDAGVLERAFKSISSFVVGGKILGLKARFSCSLEESVAVRFGTVLGDRAEYERKDPG